MELELRKVDLLIVIFSLEALRSIKFVGEFMFGIFFLSLFLGGGEEGVAANILQHFWFLKNLVYSGYNVKMLLHIYLVHAAHV